MKRAGVVKEMECASAGVIRSFARVWEQPAPNLTTRLSKKRLSARLPAVKLTLSPLFVSHDTLHDTLHRCFPLPSRDPHMRLCHNLPPTHHPPRQDRDREERNKKSLFLGGMSFRSVVRTTCEHHAPAWPALQPSQLSGNAGKNTHRLLWTSSSLLV